MPALRKQLDESQILACCEVETSCHVVSQRLKETRSVVRRYLRSLAHRGYLVLRRNGGREMFKRA
jgi:DNA-binding IclR family transcriptional regulator